MDYQCRIKGAYFLITCITRFKTILYKSTANTCSAFPFLGNICPGAKTATRKKMMVVLVKLPKHYHGYNALQASFCRPAIHLPGNGSSAVKRRN
jgi:hypothetical protein